MIDFNVFIKNSLEYLLFFHKFNSSNIKHLKLFIFSYFSCPFFVSILYLTILLSLLIFDKIPFIRLKN